MSLPSDQSWAVQTRGLRREFAVSRRDRARGGGAVVALGGVDLAIRRGELYGLLGPNGAGKTTLMKILTTLLYPSGGEARVAGFDVRAEAREVRRRIGLVSGGEYAGYGILNVRETLWMFAQFYGVPSRVARARADALMETVGLAPQAQTRVNRLSTGQRQRLAFARGFMSEPEIAFLDEPTLGLDVAAARDLRGFVRGWLDERPERTVVLTTHYMLEADELCDRISIIDRGRILATDSPLGLRGRVSTDRRVVLEVRGADGLGDALAALPEVSGLRRLESADGEDTQSWQFRVAERRGIAAVLEMLTFRGVPVVNLTTHDPSLEDVFVAIVGHGIEEGEEGSGGALVG